MLKFALAGLLLVPVLCHAEVFKCVSPEGMTTYSATPCSEGTASRLNIEQKPPVQQVTTSSQEVIDRNLRAVEIMRGGSAVSAVPQQSFDPTTAIPVGIEGLPPAPVRQDQSRPVEPDPIIIDTQSGQRMTNSGGGFTDPRTGKFYPRVAGGYIDNETGRFIPAP